MGTLLLLGGPKAAGKSWLADLAATQFGVLHVDADVLIMDLISKGATPDPEDGWLAHVLAAVTEALDYHEVVSVEITGAWESDYTLCHHVESIGHEVRRIWITAPLDETLRRLGTRTPPRVPISESEARSLYERGAARAAREHWDAVVDTSGERPTSAVAQVLRRLLDPN